METEQVLAEIIGLFRQSVNDRAVQVAKLAELIEQSEERITRVNEMVNNLVATIHGIAEKYERHLDRMADTRDATIKQNGELVELAAELRRESEKEHDRFIKLLEAYEALAMKKAGPGTAINVK